MGKSFGKEWSASSWPRGNGVGRNGLGRGKAHVQSGLSEIFSLYWRQAAYLCDVRHDIEQYRVYLTRRCRCNAAVATGPPMEDLK